MTGPSSKVIVWELPEPLPPRTHAYKYRLFYGAPGEERVRYDNERGKADHRHVNATETSYFFESVEKLFDDFERDVQAWRAT